MERKAVVVTSAALILVLLAGAWYTWQTIQKKRAVEALDNPAAQVLVQSDQYAPYTDLAGNVVRIDDYLGQVLVVNSWASWSPFSKDDLRYLASMLSEYTEEPPFRVIAINRGEHPLTAERYLQRVDASGDIILILDPDDRYYQTISGYAMPETVVYDQKGEIRLQIRGELTRPEVKAGFESLLTELADEG